MNRALRIAVSFCILFAAGKYCTNAAEPDMLYRNAKSIGMGNVKVAGEFNYNGFINNPALLTKIKKIRFCLIRLPLTVNDHVYDFGNFIKDEYTDIARYGDLKPEEKNLLINDIIQREGTWGRVFLSPMIDIAAAIHGHHFGFASYATNRIGIKMDRGIYEPRIYGSGASTVAFIFGYARSLNTLYPGLNMGVNVKFLQRHNTESFQLRARDLGDIFETTKPIYDQYRKKTTNLFVFDVGTLLELPGINSTVGASVQFLGMGDYASVDIGVTRRLLRKHVNVSADYIDVFDNNKENIFKKIHAGIEYRHYFLAFRGGINSGYPTIGFGLNFKVIDLDFAYYSEEMAKRPGVKSDNRYMTQIKIGW